MKFADDLRKEIEQFSEEESNKEALKEQIFNIELPELPEDIWDVLASISGPYCVNELPWVSEKLADNEISSLISVLAYHIKLGRIIQHLLEANYE